MKGGDNMLREFFNDESGMGVVEIILIIVVLIGLVVIFQSNIKSVVSNIFTKINSGVSKVN
jgi:Flp pilus assembly pilin Flp